jgi:hypothetical protein
VANNFDSTKVLAGRDIDLHYQAWDADVVLPLNSVDWEDHDWGGAWALLGATTDGLRFRASATYQRINVDQTVYPVAQIPQEANIALAANLAEITPEHLQLSAGMGEVDLSDPAAEDLIIGPDLTPQFYSVGADIRSPVGGGGTVRIFLPKAQPVGQSEVAVTVGAAGAIAFEAQAFPDTDRAETLVAQFRRILGTVS